VSSDPTTGGPSRAVADLRREYGRKSLNEGDVLPDPIDQFRAWFAQALAAEVPEPNAMVLATSTPDGRPSARVVLLKGVDDRGFTFHTNFLSRKGRELDANPSAALVFFWPELERQVRIEGRAEYAPADVSDDYFRGRPLGSRLGAWASPQSEVIAGREVLEARMDELARQYPEGRVPRPAHWGGIRVVPDAIEFWQGQPSRLHDRLRYRRRAEGGWVIERLAP
jgi:pyridoxamine 5'-phosphate oxidase